MLEAAVYRETHRLALPSSGRASRQCLISEERPSVSLLGRRRHPAFGECFRHGSVPCHLLPPRRRGLHPARHEQAYPTQSADPSKEAVPVAVAVLGAPYPKEGIELGRGGIHPPCLEFRWWNRGRLDILANITLLTETQLKTILFQLNVHYHLFCAFTHVGNRRIVQFGE